MKNKKTIIAIITLLLVVTIGVTFAYYTSSDDFINVFNTGKYKIVTTEEFVSPENWVPGEEIPKTIISTNEGTVPAAVRVSYVEKWEDLQGNDITSQVTPNPAIINLDNTSDWIQEGNYYYYKYILEPNQTTSSFMKSVTLDSTLNGVTCTGSGNSRTCEGNNKATGAKYKLTITKETVQADKYNTVWNTQVELEEKVPLIQLMNSERTKDNLQVGDEICINGDTKEYFNFIRYDGDNIVILAKWNLKVGSIYNSGTKIGTFTSSDEGYGLQNSEMLGQSSSETNGLTINGTVGFSNKSYWHENYNLKPKYNTSYPYADVYDPDYNDASGDNYSIAHYVEEYKDVLESYGVPIQAARLLTHDEAVDYLGCSTRSDTCPEGFVRNTSYWLGSVSGEFFAWNITSFNGYFGTYIYVNDDYFGVRPVIVISKNDI